MHERLLVAGHGGQGVILIGKLLANVAARTVPHVTFFPCYSVEVRGGTSNCQVVLSDYEIASPVCETFDSMILMNQPSADRFLANGAEGGLVLLNGSMARAPAGRRVVTIEATDIANKMGDSRVANMIMLGAYAAGRSPAPLGDIEKGILDIFHDKGLPLTQLNLQAFRRGLTLL